MSNVCVVKFVQSEKTELNFFVFVENHFVEQFCRARRFLWKKSISLRKSNRIENTAPKVKSQQIEQTKKKLSLAASLLFSIFPFLLPEYATQWFMVVFYRRTIEICEFYPDDIFVDE